MALNPYSDGKDHSEEVVESRIHGKPSSLPNRGGNPTRRDLLTRDCEHGPRWPGKTLSHAFSKTEKSRYPGKSEPGEIRRRFSGDSRIASAPGTRGQTLGGALPPRTRIRAGTGKDCHYAHRARLRLSRPNGPAIPRRKTDQVFHHSVQEERQGFPLQDTPTYQREPK